MNKICVRNIVVEPSCNVTTWKTEKGSKYNIKMDFKQTGCELDSNDMTATNRVSY